MLKQIQKITLLLTVIITTLTSTSFAGQNTDLVMPFNYNEVWDTNVINGRDEYGVHQDRTGYAMDFYASAGSSFNILAPANGTVSRGCTVRNMTFLYFDSTAGERFRFIHLAADSVIVAPGTSQYVEQGQYIGKVSAEVGNFDSATCSISNDGPHVHFSWASSSCPVVIDGYTFGCDGMRACGGTYVVNCNKQYLNQTFVSTNKPGLTPSRCSNLFRSEFAINATGNDIVDLRICLRRAYGNNYSTNYTSKYVQKTKDDQLTAGGGYIDMRINNGLTIDVPNRNSDNGNNLWIIGKNNSVAQKFYYDNTMLQIKFRGKCFDSGSGKIFSKIVIQDCSDSNSQKWEFDNQNRIVNKKEGLCMDASGGLTAASYLHLYTCHTFANQQFINNIGIKKLADVNGQPLSISQNTNLVIDASTTLVQLKKRDSSINQKLKYNSTTSQIINQNKCLSALVGTKLDKPVFVPCNEGLENQKWSRSPTGHILNSASKLCLDAANGITNNSFLHMYDCLNLPNQKWSDDIGLNYNGTLKLVNIAATNNNNLIIDIPGNNYSIGQYVQTNQNNGSSAQKFLYNTNTNEMVINNLCMVTKTGAFLDKVYLDNCNGTLAQKWSFQNGNLINTSQGKCFDAAYGLVNNSFIHLYNCVDGGNQKWRIF